MSCSLVDETLRPDFCVCVLLDHPSRMSQTYTVIVCLGERRRPVTLASPSSLEVLRARIRVEFSDILPQQEAGFRIVLQIRDESWGMFVDVVDDQRITDRSVVNVIVESAAASQKNCDSPQVCVL